MLFLVAAAEVSKLGLPWASACPHLPALSWVYCYIDFAIMITLCRSIFVHVLPTCLRIPMGNSLNWGPFFGVPFYKGAVL